MSKAYPLSTAARVSRGVPRARDARGRFAAQPTGLLGSWLRWRESRRQKLIDKAIRNGVGAPGYRGAPDPRGNDIHKPGLVRW